MKQSLSHADVRTGARVVAANGVGRILDEAGNSGSEEKGGGKDVRDDAADARLIARHDGQHPCSLFVVGLPPAAGDLLLQPGARLLVRR